MRECKGLDEKGRCRLAVIYLGAKPVDWPCQKERCRFYEQLTEK